MRRLATFGWGVAAVGALLFSAGVLPAQETTREKYDALRRQRGFDLAATPAFTYNVNNWLCGLDANGELCTNTFGSTTGGGGFWPAGTSNQYVFQFGLQWAARNPANPSGFAAAFCYNVGGGNAACRATTNIFASDNPQDLENWPDECFLWNPQTGERVKTLSQLDTCGKYWDGDPASTVPGGNPLGIEVTQHTLAYTLEGFRDMVFFIFKMKNVSGEQRFRASNPNLNIPQGGWTIEDLYVAVGHDADVSFVDSSHNFGTFVPFLNPSTPLWIGTIWHATFNAPDFEPYAQCGFCDVPGFVGTSFLRSPYNNTGEPVFNPAANRTIPPIDPERLEELRLLAVGAGLNLPEDSTIQREAQDTLEFYEIGQSFASLTTRGGVFPDPVDAAQAWRYFSGNLNQAERANTAGSPPGFGFVLQPTDADTRYFHATGPFNLAPGDSADVIVALVGGAPVLGVTGFTPGTAVPQGLPGDTTRLLERVMGRGTTGSPYPSLFRGVLDARQLFETNFLLPQPPPSPVVTAIPGDRQVSLTWSSDPVTAEDPYAPIAEARGIPNFRVQDFEGFRVYRKVRPAGEWTLIAQFDLRNGLTQVITTTDSVLSIDSTWITISADTAEAGADTGLRFALVDRGGTFPNPEQGPGLINGIRYFYTVTSYDINTPFAPGGSSLESGQRLAATPQEVGGASAVPRSTAPNVVAGGFGTEMIGSDGTELDPTQPMPAIDPDAGTFEGPIPPTNGIEVLVQPFVQELVTQQGSATFTIDSVSPGNPFHGDPAIYHITVDAPVGAEQIEVPLTIGYFGDELENEIATVLPILRGDETFAERFNVDPEQAALTAQVSALAPDAYYLAKKGRGWINSADVEPITQASTHQGAHWFVSGQAPPEDPAGAMGRNACASFGGFGSGTACWQEPDGLLAGDVPGFMIYQPMSYLSTTSALRGLESVLSTVFRAADVEVTWGAGGAVESVRDLTHNVDVPFSPAYGSTYGFLTPASFAGVAAAQTRDGNNDLLTFSDWSCVAPYNLMVQAGDTEFGAPIECNSAVSAQLQPTAALAQIDTTYAGTSRNSSARGPGANPQPGFAMYMNGQVFFFLGNALPEAGTSWTLRTFTGLIRGTPIAFDTIIGPDPEDPTAVDTTIVASQPIEIGNYTYGGTVRPPNVPGLRVVVSLTPTEVRADLRTVERVRTVPDPFIVTSPLQTTAVGRRLLFVNLPDEATIRIYSLSGVLVDALQHSDPGGGGTAEWDLRNRNNQFVASGVYFFHVESPGGGEKVGKFTVIQAP